MSTPVLQPPSGARCELEGCHRVLEGRYIADMRGHFFCGSHDGALQPCRFCGRAFAPHADAKLGACAQCTRRGVTSVKEAEARYRRAATWYEQQGLRFAAPLPRIELQVSLPKLNMLGFTEKISTGWLSSQTATPRIVMRNALPPEVFDVIASHELGHVWLAAQNVPLSEQMEEGICTWLSHRFTLSRSTPDMRWLARQIEEQTDPIYGAGFRRFSQVARGASPADLPRILKTHRTTLQS